MSKSRRIETPSTTTLYSLTAVKKIRVFKNGDIHHPGIRVVVNRKQVHDLDVFLTVLTERIDLPYGVKKLYTASGRTVKSIDDLEDGKDYIASSNIFIALDYGDAYNRIQSSMRKSRSLEPDKRRKTNKIRVLSTKRLSSPPEKEIAVVAAVDENSIKKKTTKKSANKEKKESESKSNKKKENGDKQKKSAKGSQEVKPPLQTAEKKKDLDILVLHSKPSSPPGTADKNEEFIMKRDETQKIKHKEENEEVKKEESVKEDISDNEEEEEIDNEKENEDAKSVQNMVNEETFQKANLSEDVSSEIKSAVEQND